MHWFSFSDNPPKNTMIIVRRIESSKKYYALWNSNRWLGRIKAQELLRQHNYELERCDRSCSPCPREEEIEGKMQFPTEKNCTWQNEKNILSEEDVKKYTKILEEPECLERDIDFINIQWNEVENWTYLSELDRYDKLLKEDIVNALEKIAYNVT